jgi:hypothetical protein
MTSQEMLEQLIDEAWQDFLTIAKEEKEDGYSDAMVSMDRTRAEGFAEGLQLAYRLVFDTDYNPLVTEEEED